MTETVRLDRHAPAAQQEAPREDRVVAPDDRPPRRGRAVRVLVVVAIVAAFAGGAFGYSLLQPRVYGAEAQLLLTPRPELSDTAAERAMLTQVEVVKSTAVLQPVAARTGVALPRLAKAVSAGIVGRTNILRVTVADRDRTRAVTLAQLIVVQYGQMAGAASFAGTASIESTVLTPARPLDHPVQPRPLRALAAGALVGLLVAAATLAALWRPWRRYRTPYWT